MLRAVGRTLQSNTQNGKAQDWSLKACEALEKGRCLLVDHGDFCRTIEVHRVGIGPRGEQLISGWQILGPDGERVGWKLINLADCVSLTVSELISQAPRPDYRRGTKQFIGVISQL
jgi:hypothetical protein